MFEFIMNILFGWVINLYVDGVNKRLPQRTLNGKFKVENGKIVRPQTTKDTEGKG